MRLSSTVRCQTNKKNHGKWTDCTILGRHFERVSVPAHVRDKYKILMADRELAFVSGRTRRLFPRVRFHFWPQRRRYTCILFLSCELRRSRSRQNSRARQSTDPGSSLAFDLQRLCGGFMMVDLPMKGFIKTWFQRIWGKVSVDNLVVCQGCRSLWSTCTSNALPHRWRNRYRAQGQGKRSLEGWILFREDHVPDSDA